VARGYASRPPVRWCSMAPALPTQIAASATGPQSGQGGTVTVEAGTDHRRQGADRQLHGRAGQGRRRQHHRLVGYRAAGSRAASSKPGAVVCRRTPRPPSPPSTSPAATSTPTSSPKKSQRR
jgi:hypothetical protein